MCFIITLNNLFCSCGKSLVYIFNPSVDIWDLEKYGIQYLSFQCTVQDLGIWSENIRGGLQSLSPKDKFMWYITVETGWMDLDICGNEWKNGKDRRPMELHTVWKDHVDIMAFTGNPVIRFDNKKDKTSKNIKLHCSVEKLCGPYAIWRKKKNKNKEKALETIHASLSQLYLHLFRKIEPTCLHYLHKMIQCLYST